MKNYVDPVSLKLFVFDDGQLIPDGLVEAPERPTIHHRPVVFDDNTIQWIADSASLEIEVKAKRDQAISNMDWRYVRYSRETRLGIVPHDDIAKLDAYVQELADITKQPGYPENVTWPVEP